MNISLLDLHPTTRIVSASRLTLNLPRPPQAFYRHGWQSWSLTAWTAPVPLPDPRPTLFHPMHIDPAYAGEPLPHGSWVGAVRFEDGTTVLLGALGLESHVRLNGDHLEGWYESGEGEWLLCVGEESACFQEYVRRLETSFSPPGLRPAPRVWCSWYSLYTAISERLLLSILNGLGDLPFDVFQIDDGWQASIGDWEANRKFPSGMAALADRIRASGRTAGLWLAPWIAVPSSRLFREHPDWFLRDERGRLVSAGFNWGEPLYALDLTLPPVQDWLFALMRRVRSWGFDYLKLDFLYAGALPGIRRGSPLSREMAYREGLRLLRQGMGEDAFLLTCGAPILPSLGLCDAMRVGPDVAGIWESDRDAVLLYNHAMPGARNALRTTLHRLWLSPLVHPDPDVVYFSRRENTLTAEHISWLHEIARICRFKATSDLPQWLSPDERQALRAFLEETNQVRHLGNYRFQIDGRVTDFSSVVALPDPPHTWKARLQAAVLGWLGNQPWVLRRFYAQDQRRLQALAERVEADRDREDQGFSKI